MIVNTPPKAPGNGSAHDYIKQLKVWEKVELRPFKKDKIPADLRVKALTATLAEHSADKEGLHAGFSRLSDMNFLNPLDDTFACSQGVSRYCDQVIAVTGAKKADTITQSIMIMTHVRPLGTPVFAHWEKWNAAYASIAWEPDLAMSPKVVAAMLSVSLNATRTNAMEGFVSQFINVCERSPVESLLMNIERLIIRSKEGFRAAESAEPSIVSRRPSPNGNSRSNLASDFDLEKTDAIVRSYVSWGVNRASWRRWAGNVEMTEKLRAAMHGKDNRHSSLCFLLGHLYRFYRTPKEMVSAIRRILQWLVPSANAPISLDDKGTPVQSRELIEAVRSFYTSETFRDLDTVIRERIYLVSGHVSTSYAAFETTHLDPIVANPSTDIDEPWFAAAESGFSFLSSLQS